MRYHIFASHIELTPSIKEYAEAKILRPIENYTAQYDADAVTLDVEVAKTTAHHNKGDVWYAEVTLVIDGHTIHNEATEEELYAAIDVVSESVIQELKKFKSRLSTLRRRGGRAMKWMLRRDK